jgi:hypothetical protein
VRRPEFDDLAPLRDQTAIWFERWLRLGLKEYLFERRGRYAFPGAEDFIEQGEGDIANDLTLIGRSLSSRDLDNFSTAVTHSISGLDFTDARGATVAITLMKLGAGIHARGISRVVADKAFSIPDTQIGRQLYELAFSLAGQLADIEREDAIACLRHLINLPKLFRYELSGRALLALTKADPREFPAHFELLRPALDRRFGLASNSQQEENRRRRQRQRLIAALIAIVPDPTLLASPCAPESEQRGEEDNWWAMTLAEHFPLLLDELSSIFADQPKRVLKVTHLAEPPRPVRGAPKKAQWDYALTLLGGERRDYADMEVEYAL